MEKIGINNSKKRDRYLKDAFKLYDSGLPVSSISQKLGISTATIYRWLCTFAAGNQATDVIMRKKTIQEPKSINPEELATLPPEDQVAYLKEALRKAELRAEAYDTMIDIAESKFKIPIRKKAGVKQ